MEMHRLRCGIIYSGAFASYLAERQKQEQKSHPGEILALDYVRCASGPGKGNEWWQIGWVGAQNAPETARQRIGEVDVFIHRQSIRGLKTRLLHFANGEVVVKS